MTKVSPTYDKNIMEAIFRRRGGNGASTGLFRELDTSTSKKLLANFIFLDSEETVVGSDYDNSLCALTTERILYSSEKSCLEVNLSNIFDAIVDLKELQRKGVRLNQADHIQLLMSDGRKLAIKVEPGSPLSGIWSILKHIGDKNRRK